MEVPVLSFSLKVEPKGSLTASLLLAKSQFISRKLLNYSYRLESFEIAIHHLQKSTTV